MSDALKKEIDAAVENLALIKNSLQADEQNLMNIGTLIREAIKNGSKVLVFGNGGSAADAQHFTAEIVGRFKRERKGFPAIALTTDTSAITAIGNDYGFRAIFMRQVEALGTKGDISIGISTSGRSENVAAALEKSRELGLKTVALTGGDGGEIIKFADISVIFPASDTPRIQEYHTVVLHIIAAVVDFEEFRK
jgi:D-sedoheptulose 7-phosphate isomerase